MNLDQRDLNLLFESLPGLYLILNPDDYTIVHATNAYLQATMTDRAAIVERCIFDVFPGDPNTNDKSASAALRKSLERVKLHKQADVMGVQYYPVINPNTGQFEERYWSPINTPVLTTEGTIAYIVHRVEDITDYVALSHTVALKNTPNDLTINNKEIDILLRSRELKELNEKLYLSEERWRGIFNDTSTAIATQNQAGGFLSVNQAFCTMLGYSEAELCQLDIWTLVDPNDLDESQQLITNLIIGKQKNLVKIIRFITKSRNKIWVRTSISLQKNNEGEVIGFISVCENITAQREAEQAEELLSEQLINTLENMTDAFLLIDKEWCFSFINRSAENLLQKTKAELQGKNLWEEYPNAVGSQLESEYHGAVQDGRSRHFEYYYPPLNKWLEINAYPTKQGLAVYFRSIDERRHLEHQLREAQRLESLGLLTGGIAHDFNNLLTVIIGNAELLTEELHEQERYNTLSRMISKAATHGAELTQRLLAFARRQALEPKIVDITRLLDEMQPMLQRTLGEHIVVHHHHDAALFPVLVDPAQLESSILNLAINSRDAMQSGGHLTFSTSNVFVDQLHSHAPIGVPQGKYVCILISDTGHGIQQDHLAHVFEPFFSTKAKDKGTGLGLSMVFGFIKQSGGHINITSDLGIGTSISIYLPVATDNDEERYKPGGYSALPRGGDETILLVEDDELVRKFATQQLSNCGYKVIEASNGEQGLKIIQENKNIDLLFTDVIMPGKMGGKELGEIALQLRPGLKILFTAGYAENAIVHDGRLDRGLILLKKPYHPKELLFKVRSLLDA